MVARPDLCINRARGNKPAKLPLPLQLTLAVATLVFLVTAARVSLTRVSALILILAWSAIHWFTGAGSSSFSQASELGRVVFPAVRLATVGLLVTLALFLRPDAMD